MLLLGIVSNNDYVSLRGFKEAIFTSSEEVAQCDADPNVGKAVVVISKPEVS